MAGERLPTGCCMLSSTTCRGLQLALNALWSIRKHIAFAIIILASEQRHTPSVTQAVAVYALGLRRTHLSGVIYTPPSKFLHPSCVRCVATVLWLAQVYLHFNVGGVAVTLKTRSSAVADKPPDACARYAVLSRAALWWLTALYWLNFSTFTYRSSIWRPQRGKSPRAIGFKFGTGKLEWLGYNTMKVAWWLTQSFGHNTSTWQTHRQPRRHRKRRANALRRAAMIIISL